jgi:internalin A
MRINVLAPITLVIGILSINTQLVTAAPNPQYKTFLEWCNNQNRIATDAKHTVNKLLEKVETTNCQQANQRLLALKNLDLSYREITNL